jgi:(p)ppGpp synthase/HD superfamily hydrolase
MVYDIMTSIRPFVVAQMMIYHLHRDQQYGGRPYFLHPIEVAYDLMENTQENVGHGFAENDWIIAALLHDVVEDTPMPLEDIEAIFGDAVAEIVELCTKDESLSYRENIQRIVDSKNIGAMFVKLSDNRVNFRNSPKESLIGRYTMSIKMLTKAILEAGVNYKP